jgi:hypothetical protein
MDRGYVGGMLDDHREGRGDYTRQLFLLFSLEIWNRRFLGVPVR